MRAGQRFYPLVGCALVAGNAKKAQLFIEHVLELLPFLGSSSRAPIANNAPPNPAPPHVPPQPEIPSGCGASTISRSPPGRSSSSRQACSR